MSYPLFLSVYFQIYLHVLTQKEYRPCHKMFLVTIMLRNHFENDLFSGEIHMIYLLSRWIPVRLVTLSIVIFKPLILITSYMEALLFSSYLTEFLVPKFL